MDRHKFQITKMHNYTQSAAGIETFYKNKLETNIQIPHNLQNFMY